MGEGIAEVLTYAVAVAISLLSIIAVTIAGPVAYYFIGGERAKAKLASLKDWLAIHNAAVMTVLLVIFGVDLIAKGLPPLTG